MSVKGVIFDVSDTMLSRGTAVEGIVDTIDRLRGLGVQVIAVNNDGPQADVARELNATGIQVDHVVTAREVGKNKGSPLWIELIQALTGLQANELLYVGDSKYDMITASHGRVVYLHAAWSGKQSEYGLPAPNPAWVAAVVEHIFRKQHPWGWSYSYQNPGGTPIRQMALADVNVLKRAGIQGNLVEMLKDRGEPQVGLMPLREFVALQLTASIYAEGLQNTTDVWTVMPSHDGQRVSKMGQLFDLTAKLFRDRYTNDLLQRHAPAQHSYEARSQHGLDGAIANQINTLLLNPALVEKIYGKTVLIIDDFLTMGVTTGVGQVLLRMGGAADVITIGVGKFGHRTTVLGRPSGDPWDVASPAPPNSATTVRRREENGIFHQQALDEFVTSYQAMQGEQW